MPKVSPLQSNFGGGEFSPLAQGRVDADRYKTGLNTCLNYIPLMQGALTRRPGTKFVAEVKDSTAVTRLVHFEFSTTQAYMIEFGNLYCRFYKNNALITLAAQNIGGILKSNPAIVSLVAHGYSNGDRVFIANALGMTQVDNREFTVAGATADTFELSGVDATGFDDYVSGGTVAKIYEIVSPYTTAELPGLRFVQSADTLYIVAPVRAPRKLTRTDHTSWTLTIISFLDGPYLSTNTTATTITPSATTGSVTLTASAALFTANDVGRLVRIKHSSTWGWATITAFTDSTHVTALVGSAFGAATASADWRLGLYMTGNYPTSVAFHEDRLAFAGAGLAPQRVDMSKSGDYENFAPTATDGTTTASNAIAATLNADDVNVIRWMSSDEKGLQLGTAAAEWSIRAATTGEALSPTNVTARRITNYGSANVEPVQAGKAVLFVQARGRKVLELGYAFDVDGYRAPDMTVLAEHVTQGGLAAIVRQQEPQPVVWGLRNDGVLAGLTYERDIDTLKVGWHRHILGGVGTVGGAAPVVESVAVIPSADGTRDELWLIVKRYINGGTKRYVEYLTKLYESTDAQKDACFLDCSLTYSGSAATSIGGLHHLEGQTVSVWADGAEQPNVTVTNAKITLQTAASVVQIGYVYNSDAQLLRIEAGAADGTALGKIRRTHDLSVLLFQTLGLKFGMSFSSLDTINFRTFEDPMDTPLSLFSGIKELGVEADYDTENMLCFRQDGPAPGTILAVMPKMVTQDRG